MPESAVPSATAGQPARPRAVHTGVPQSPDPPGGRGDPASEASSLHPERLPPRPHLSPRILAALTAPAQVPPSSPECSAHNGLAPFGVLTSDVKQEDFRRKTQDATFNCQQCQDLNSLCPLKRSVNFIMDDSYGLNCL